jgi:hypothetical protein
MTLPAAMTDLWLKRLGWLFIGWSLLVLVVAYAAMSWEHSTPLLWNVVVHEDGHRSFAQTLFYFDHITRELLHDLLLGAAIGAGGAAALAHDAPGPRKSRPITAAALLFCIVLMIGETVRSLGWEELRLNLLQYPTREGEPPVWGAHWRYHLLERGPLMLLALGLWGILLAFRPAGVGKRGLRAGAAAIAVYLGLTLVFTPDLHALSLPFADTRFLGHEIREIFTHGAVTLPLGIGLVILSAGEGTGFTAQSDRRLLWALALIGIAAAFFVYVLSAAIGADAASAGQSDSVITLLAPHFFEHGFTYIVTPFSALLVFERLR